MGVSYLGLLWGFNERIHTSALPQSLANSVYSKLFAFPLLQRGDAEHRWAWSEAPASWLPFPVVSALIPCSLP